MAKEPFLVRARWWFLVGGVVLILTILGALFGLVLIVLAIIGFVQSDRSRASAPLITLPSFVDIELPGVSDEKLDKCPVCGSRVAADQDGDLTCESCGSCLKRLKTGNYRLKRGSSDNLDSEFGYDNMVLSVRQWNAIRVTGKTVEEKAIEQIKNGNVPLEDASQLEIPLKFKKDEKIAHFERVDFYEPRAVRNYGGGTVRVAKGVYMHTGQARSHQELTKVDNGTFVISNKRILFAGSSKSMSVDLKKIMSTDIFKDGLRVSKEGRQKPFFFATNYPVYCSAVIDGLLK